MKIILSLFMFTALAVGAASCAMSDAPQTSDEAEDLVEPNAWCTPPAVLHCIDTPDSTCCQCNNTGEWRCAYKPPILTP